jgi:hypothetical protein
MGISNRYLTKEKPFTGSTLKLIEEQARALYKAVARQTKRNPYVRSRYFKKDKIFLELFWVHVKQKHANEQKRRLKLYPCAIDLLKNTACKPDEFHDSRKSNERYYRFYGITDNGVTFCVQVKEDKRTGNKHFMSVFPMK